MKSPAQLIAYLKDAEGFTDNDILVVGSTYLTPNSQIPTGGPCVITSRYDGSDIHWISQWIATDEGVRCIQMGVDELIKYPVCRRTCFRTIYRGFPDSRSQARMVGEHDEEVAQFLSLGWSVVATGLSAEFIWTKISKVMEP